MEDNNVISYREFLKKRTERILEEAIDEFIDFIADLLNWEKEEKK